MFFSLIVVGFLGFYLLTSIFFPSSKKFHEGPPSYPILGCLISFSKNRGRLLDWYTNLLSVSPSQTIVVQRLGARRTIVTANPANVEHMLKTNFINYPKGKPFTEILGDLLGCGLFNVDGELWNSQRKLASHEFSTKTLREYVVKKLKEEVENRLVPLLDEAVKGEPVLDLQDVLKRFAFDIVCKVSLGIDPRCLDLSLPVPPLTKAFDAASEISAMRAMEPVAAVWKLKKALNLGLEKKLREEIKIVHGSVLEIVRDRKKVLQNDQEGSDLLSKLLLAGHNEEVIRDMIISIIMAGRDTTLAAITWLFWLLSRHRNTDEMILNEVTSLLNNGEKEMDFEILKDMNFLKTSLCESMTLYPPVAWDSKHVAKDDVLPDGTFVEKGDRVTYFPYGMGRMENLWGKNSLEFRPDRWFEEPVVLETSGGALKQVSPYKFPVFQEGPRVCLGKEMAFMQMKYVVASILTRFKIRPVCQDQPVFVPLLTAHMAGGFKVKIERRDNNLI